MGAFIIRRLTMGLVVLFIVTIITFLLIHIMPGDPVMIMLGIEATPERVQSMRQELWLDRHLVEQYGHWLSNFLKGDFGRSINFGEDVSSLIMARLPITMHLALVSTVLTIIFGIGAGIICAVRRGTFLDSIITFAANIGVAVPIFWLGILGIYFFGLKLGWLPIQGYTSPFVDFLKNTRQIIMPVICMAIPGITVLARQTRSSMLEVIGEDYIRTAWAKGMREKVIVSKHALKNALIPIVTLLGLHLRIVVGGSVLVERVFNIPGIGRLMVESVLSQDFIVVQACTLWLALFILLANLIVDISYGWLDPRIRYD